MLKRAFLLLTLVTAASWCGPVFGQAARPDPKEKEAVRGLRDATRSSPWMWDVQSVIDNYVKVMSGMYGLTETQEQYTRELMNQRVKQFLKDYEKDVRTLLGEYVQYRTNGEMPSGDAAKDFARRAQPLLTAIRQEIMDGNMQWRKVLNEEQLKRHDRDMAMLTQQFDMFDQSMKRWADGNVQPSDLGLPDRNRPWTVRKIEDAMGDYVKNFIARYGLDEGQRQTAYSILREAREEATRYRDSHKEDFAQLEAKQKELAASNPNGEEEVKRTKEEGRKLTERLAALEKPLNDELFARFKERLESIPTSDQRAAYEAKQNALKERLAKLRHRATSTTLPAASAPASAPATAPAE